MPQFKLSVADKLTAGKAAAPIFVISKIWDTTKTDHGVMKHLWQVKARLNAQACVLVWYERCDEVWLGLITL